jgi:glycosyltransferase involved in cell wall biosynthesis
MVKLSIITPSYNQAAFIRHTLESVRSQRLGDEVEHLVVDGGSTDGTLEILKDHSASVTWLSEPDKGQADAVNKGIRMARGMIIGWLNSDDVYLPGALKAVIDHFDSKPECMWLYGRCRIIDSNGKEIWKPVTWYKNLQMRRFSYKRLLVENYINQPAVFFRKSFIEEVGLLDTRLKYTMDYDLWCRFGQKHQADVLRQYLSGFRRHSTSKSDTGFTQQFREGYSVALRYESGWFRLLLHRLNNRKIILSYRLMNLFR